MLDVELALWLNLCRVLYGVHLSLDMKGGELPNFRILRVVPLHLLYVVT